jgi:hypothetical protein
LSKSKMAQMVTYWVRTSCMFQHRGGVSAAQPSPVCSTMANTGLPCLWLRSQSSSQRSECRQRRYAEALLLAGYWCGHQSGSPIEPRLNVLGIAELFQYVQTSFGVISKRL